MANTAGFYGQVSPLITPQISRSPFRRTSGSSMPSGSKPSSMTMGDFADLFSGNMVDATPLRRGTRTLEQKMDAVLQALENQKDDNAALKSQLRVLEEKFDNNSNNNTSGNAKKKTRIPSSLSVSALCSLFNFSCLFYRKK